MAEKHVYKFSKTLAEGNRDMRDLLGGKGANLHEMCKMGLPVPPGFTITTDSSTSWRKAGKKWPEGFRDQVREAMSWLEGETGKNFGDPKNPLLVSVRSGARVSMPGMMDTVLNLGLNDETMEGLAKATGNRRFALDAYRRFIYMFGDVVLGIKAQKGEDCYFHSILDEVKKRSGKTEDTDLNEEELDEIVSRYKAVIEEKHGEPFAQDPWMQLAYSIHAVFSSWMNDRAIEYRKIYQISSDWGTAVNVQTMVFGNMGDDCGTGVAFTRDPASGENLFYGEFLMNAQGEDVVAGLRTPHKIEELKGVMPSAYDQLEEVRNILEEHYRDMQDIEFTIERSKLYMLQCRSGKRTGLASIRIALDMLEEGLIDEKTAISRVDANQVTSLMRPVFNPDAVTRAHEEGRMLAKGLPAGPGAASGRVCFYSDEVEEFKKEWGQVILVRVETSPEDIKGMEAAEGILTARGGMTSHAALVARQRGKACVSGCGALEINYRLRSMKIGEQVVVEGDPISIDGTTGEVFVGEIENSPSEVIEVLIEKTRKPEDSATYRRFARLMEIADKYRSLGIRTNSDQPSEAEMAVAFGAEGIGLARTEHMFFGGDRLIHMRKMILSEDLRSREAALADLLPFQREDFVGLFQAMAGKPVTIRMIDPPLHEFVPQSVADMKQLGKQINVPWEKIRSRVEDLEEQNPMLGHRGCRLGITYPEITAMQSRAIFEAACEVQKKGINVFPELMVPLVGHVGEFKNQEKIIRDTAAQVFEEQDVQVQFMVGTMIELPRAAICADQIAEAAEFFSFGTNDLTQTTFGMSRDDYGKFIGEYIDREIIKADPFVSIDEGIGRLIEIAVERGKSTRKDIKLGICGEQGGDPDSIDFCHKAGLNYVSCSPYRIPVARVAAAQASIKNES